MDVVRTLDVVGLDVDTIIDLIQFEIRKVGVGYKLEIWVSTKSVDEIMARLNTLTVSAVRQYDDEKSVLIIPRKIQ